MGRRNLHLPNYRATFAFSRFRYPHRIGSTLPCRSTRVPGGKRPLSLEPATIDRPELLGRILIPGLAQLPSPTQLPLLEAGVSADRILAEPSIRGNFVVSRAGEAYDARV